MDIKYSINALIILLILCVVLVVLAVLLIRKPRSEKSNKNIDYERFTFPKIIEYVDQTINEYLSVNLLDLGLSEDEYERRKANIADLKSALRLANTGDIREKTFVKQFIFDLLQTNYGINENNVNLIIPFNDPKALTIQDIFEITLYIYKKKYGFDGLKVLIEENKLDQMKRLIEDDSVDSYIITEDEIRSIFQKQRIKELSIVDQLNIVVQRVYQDYKGHGVVDLIRDMKIDGVSGGVSGIPKQMQLIDDELDLLNSMKESSEGNNSVWIFFKGKTIHLSFLAFENDLELKRVCQNIYKNDNPSQLTESDGFIVNDMKDGSRVVVVRPPYAESWAFFVRKFDLPNMTLERLIPDDSAANADLPRDLMKYLIKSCRFTAITGVQGSGKTSLLMALVKYIYGHYPLRIQEMMFELHLRRLYPERNNLATRETETISGQKSLDAHKKMDGAISILGEVATDEVASWAIKMGTVNSRTVLLTAHPSTFENLVFYLRNALVNMKYIPDTKLAEEQVAKSLEFDIHVENRFGKRYIERITEGIFLEDDVEHIVNTIQDLAKNDSIEGKLDALVTLLLEDFKKKNKRVWEAKNIVEYIDGKYVPKTPLSQKKVTAMLAAMTPEDGESFKAFLQKYWGHVTYDF